MWRMLDHLTNSGTVQGDCSGPTSIDYKLDFSAAFDRVSHSGLLFKLKCIGVGGSVLSIWREFLSNHRQRVMDGGATSEWIPIVSGGPQGSVLGASSVNPIYQRNVSAVWEQTTCICWWLHITGSCSQASKQTFCCCLPLTGTCLGYRSGTITGAWYWILTKLRL